jgi:hypothetical protein
MLKRDLVLKTKANRESKRNPKGWEELFLEKEQKKANRESHCYDYLPLLLSRPGGFSRS